MSHHFRNLIIVAIAGIALGCTPTSPEPTRIPVSGTVTLDGKPLAKGMIYFKTVAAGSIDSVDVIDGKYAGQAEAGVRRVEIIAYKPATGGTPGMGGSEVNYIPAKYNVDSKLTAEVTASGPNDFPFDITSK